MDVIEGDPLDGTGQGVLQGRLVTVLRSTTAGTVLATGVASATGVLLSIYVVRTFGAVGRGRLTAALLWPSLLVHIGSMGFVPSLLYHVSRVTRPVGVLLSSALWVAAAQSLGTVALGYVLMPHVLAAQPQQVVRDAQVGLLLVPASLGFVYGLSALQARLHFRSYNTLRAAVPVGTLLVIVAVAQQQAVGLRWLVVVPVVLNALATLVCVLLCARMSLLQARLPDAGAVRALLGYGVRAQLGDLATLTNVRLDQVLLAALAAPGVLGLYVIGLSSSTLLTVLISSMRSVLQPRVANAGGSGGAAVAVRAGLRRYLVLGGAVWVASAAATPVVLPLVFGEVARTPGCIPAAEILLLATFAFGFKELCAGSLQALGDPWAVSRTDLASLVLTVGGLAAATRYGGLVAIATVSLAAYGVQAALLLWLLDRRLRLDATVPQQTRP